MRFGLSDEQVFVLPKDPTYSLTEEAGIYTILDTSSTTLHISNLWFDSFIEQLELAAGTKFETHEGRMYSRCLPNFPSLFFLMNGISPYGAYLEVAAKEYVVDVSRA